MKKFKNISEETFFAKWAGKVTELNPGDKIIVEDNIAIKFAKDLAFMQINKERAEQERKLRSEGKDGKTPAITSKELQAVMELCLEDVQENSNIERAEKPIGVIEKAVEDKEPADSTEETLDGEETDDEDSVSDNDFV